MPSRSSTDSSASSDEWKDHRPGRKERRGAPTVFHRILVATDLTPGCAAVFAKGLALAKMSGAELLIAHVYRPPNLSLAEAVAPGVYDEWDFNLRTEVARRLDPFVESARRQLVAARALVLSGVPRKAILAAATETRTDLIVIGSRERHGLGRLFRRSLSSRIASSARCRVMTVRANPAGQRLPPFDHRT